MFHEYQEVGFLQNPCFTTDCREVYLFMYIQTLWQSIVTYIELKVNNYTFILPQIYVFFMQQFYFQDCTLFTINVCCRINSIFVTNFCHDFVVSQFWIKLIDFELKVNNYTIILPQIYVFYVFAFLIKIFLYHEYHIKTLSNSFPDKSISLSHQTGSIKIYQNHQNFKIRIFQTTPIQY